jgi:hypothetical protein
MSYIVSYRKNITRHTTESLLAPEGSTELCLLPDGFTYVSIPDDEAIDIEAQPESVRHTLDFPVLTPELVEAISQASTHVQLINERVRDMIAQQYPMCEEIKLLRTAPSEEFDIYNAHVEACRQWGREQKALLGL